MSVLLSRYLGPGALVLGILAVYLGLPNRIFLQSDFLYDIGLSLGLSSPPTAIDTDRNVSYVGTHRIGIEHFQNIFYAEDTSGENRFAPPVPFRPAVGSIVDATQPGAWCQQGTGDILPFTSRITNVSENCLSLRIARPFGTKAGDDLPVVVWVHGGGHILGSASDILYEPDGLLKQGVNDGRPMIFVSINYRLGLFGFAKSKPLLEDKHTNAGLRDQRAALEWVRDNIRYFGGNPHKVTGIGHSVGSSDLALQLTAFGGEQAPLFQQLILLSGGPNLNFNTMSDLVSENTADVAHAVGCVVNNDSQSRETLACLRGKPADLLTNVSITAARAARPPFGEAFFFPAYDGDMLPDRASNLLRAGKFPPGVRILGSWDANDGAWYASPATASDDDGVLATVGRWLPGLSPATRRQLLALYPPSDFVRYGGGGHGLSPQYHRAAQLSRDLWFACPVVDMAWQYARRGGDRGQVRLLEHNATRYGPVFAAMGVPVWRVAHLSVVPYVLGRRRLGGGADNSRPQVELAREVSRSVARFVATGDPDPPQEGTARGGWAPAFSEASAEELAEDAPSRLNLKLHGGPHHGEVVAVGDEAAEKETLTEAEQAVGWEKLIERCAFINSETVRAEMGV
ncbi:lipase [Xylariomycetidae sp. FL0641]|nr:lipase [Xylariomycetidae sp. FL0641]